MSDEKMHEAAKQEVIRWNAQLAAARHASRYRTAGVRHVYDLGCGIGSESIALLTAGVDVMAVELDPFTARVAAHNLSLSEQSVGSAHARVIVDDAQRVHVDRHRLPFALEARADEGVEPVPAGALQDARLAEHPPEHVDVAQIRAGRRRARFTAL